MNISLWCCSCAAALQAVNLAAGNQLKSCSALDFHIMLSLFMVTHTCQTLSTVLLNNFGQAFKGLRTVVCTVSYLLRGVSLRHHNGIYEQLNLQRSCRQLQQSTYECVDSAGKSATQGNSCCMLLWYEPLHHQASSYRFEMFIQYSGWIKCTADCHSCQHNLSQYPSTFSAAASFYSRTQNKTTLSPRR